MGLAIHILAYLAFALVLGDVFSTIAALRRPGVHEANPVVRWFMAVFGTSWVIPRILMGLGTVAGAFGSGDGWGEIALLVAAIGLTGYAVVNNIIIARG
jgi:hypothetical protein